MKKILIVDNYDSFVYNIHHIVEELGYTADIYRNDKITLDEVEQYDKIILSPGPGIPSEAGILTQLIARYAPTKSIFGVCLGEQAIGEVFGATLTNLTTVFHGIASEIEIISPDPLFEGVDTTCQVGRYHSWVVDTDNFPTELEITAIDKVEGRVMALRHRTYDVRGVQFHPESVLTPAGKTMIKNWLES